jgi:pimeloyl-ACP methyl ester carboxylesterase
MLEVIDKGSCSEEHPVPLLFVHGAWHAAWCWDEHFLSFFADTGYRALAVSLRGHGGSPAPKRMQSCSVADFVEDVGSVANGLPTRPIVIGHSMGGFVVQKYLETHDAPAGVLLASVPPRGAGGFMLRNMRRHPWHTIRSTVTSRSLRVFNSSALVREYFYSPTTPEADVVRYGARLGEEFVGRATRDMTFRDLPKPERIATPLLVMGAECDGCLTVEEVRATALAYGTEAEIFPSMGHNMMVEPEWEAVAHRMHSWIEMHVSKT